MDPNRIELHPEAIAEARDARRWYAERSSVAANAFMAELDLAIDRICESPDRWATYLLDFCIFRLQWHYAFCVS